VTGHALDTVKEALKCLYSDECTVTPKNVTALLNFSKEFDVPVLNNACGAFIGKKMNIKTAYAMLSDVPDVCYKFFDRHAVDAVKAPQFMALPKEQLITLIGRNGFNVPEARLFQQVVKWITRNYEEEKKESKQSEEEKAAARVAFAKPILANIRFPLMTTTELATVVSATGLLPDQTLVSLFSFLSVPQAQRKAADAAKIGFKMNKRRRIYV
jgi:hypothetical protein